MKARDFEDIFYLVQRTKGQLYELNKLIENLRGKGVEVNILNTDEGKNNLLKIECKLPLK